MPKKFDIEEFNEYLRDMKKLAPKKPAAAEEGTSWKGPRPTGATFAYTCNKCGVVSYNEYWMQIHQHRSHGIEPKMHTTIIRRPEFP